MRASGAARVVRRLVDAAPPGLRRFARRKKLQLKARVGDLLIPEQEFELAVRRALLLLRERRPRDELGDYLEFGVFMGTSLACAHRAVDSLGLESVRLIGFDSFEGLPATAEQEGGSLWRAGDFASDYDYVRTALTEAGIDWGRVTLVPGWFDETLTAATRKRLNLRKASVLMVDCDLYSSTRTALAFCEPLIHGEAVVFFDDWQTADLADQGEGESRAFEEFLAEHPDITAEELELAYVETARAFLLRR